MTVRVFFDGEPVDLPGDTPAAIDTDTLDAPAPGLTPAKRPVVLRHLAWFRDLRSAFVRREGKWVLVRVEGWAEEASRLRGDLARAGIRYRIALAIDGASRAIVDGTRTALDRTKSWASKGLLSRVRGYGLALAVKITPCRCKPGSAFFCCHKLPPEPGRHFGRDCDCQCHGGL